jgi:hypothetical protein
MTTETRRLTMRVAGGLVKHLGLQMYSGAVPAIAELISNAWDAMARNVSVDIPLNRPLQHTDRIVVKDDGHGMSFEECNEHYLVVGRDRRKEEGDLSKPYGGRPRRRLMSRKGIGKLAGFGIANRIDIRTVRDGRVTHFAMDYDAMTRSGKFVDEYEPELLKDDGETTGEPDGTRILLTEMKITRAIPEEQFRSSLARRFTVLEDEHFRVHVNGEELRREEQPFQFRYPPGKGDWNEDEITGVGTIQWWFGFRKEPIPDEDARGIVVLARGKLAQAPWFFGLSGGVYGQHGMQYMTGEVQADFLDVTDGPDLIATDRGSVLWEEPPAAALRSWGVNQVKELLRDWANRRVKDKTSRPEVRRYLDLAERLPEPDRRIFHSFVSKITSIPQLDKDQEILDELVRFGYNALTNHRFLDVIRQLNAASPEDRDKVVDILAEWDVMEAVQTAQKVKGRVEIIRKFREMVEAGVPEKPDMHEFLKHHPWLIDPQWEVLQHEKALDTLLTKEFHSDKTGQTEAGKRVDFFCLATARQWEVVELKRPGDTVGTKELDQTRDYVFFLREHAKKTNDPRCQVDRVGGILIHSERKSETSQHVEALEKVGIYVRDWDTLLRTAEALHKDFLDVITKRAPADDPRIRALGELEEPEYRERPPEDN